MKLKLIVYSALIYSLAAFNFKPLVAELIQALPPQNKPWNQVKRILISKEGPTKLGEKFVNAIKNDKNFLKTELSEEALVALSESAQGILALRKINAGLIMASDDLSKNMIRNLKEIELNPKLTPDIDESIRLKLKQIENKRNEIAKTVTDQFKSSGENKEATLDLLWEINARRIEGSQNIPLPETISRNIFPVHKVKHSSGTYQNQLTNPTIEAEKGINEIAVTLEKDNAWISKHLTPEQIKKLFPDEPLNLPLYHPAPPQR